MKTFQKKREKLTRFQALKSIFSSLLLTTTAIVIAVIVIPASPVASIDSVQAFTEAITYSVSVTDSDNAIIEGTLELVLENQFDTYSQPATLGVNNGIFESLEPDTKYTLKVMADKGYGLEVLDKSVIKTEPNPGGAITDIQLLSPPNEYTLDYSLTCYISDPFQEYDSIQITYAYRYPQEEDYANLQTIMLSPGQTEVFISNITNNNVQVLVRLEALTNTSELITLEQVEFYTPYQFYGEAYLHHVTNREAKFDVYAESMSEDSPEFELVLMEGYVEIGRERYTVPAYSEQDPQFEQQTAPIVFEHLKPDTEYEVKVFVTYTNPFQKNEETKELAPITFTTLPDFKADVTVTDLGDMYEVTILLNDPQSFYDMAYYQIYQVDEFYDYVMEYNSYPFEMIDDENSVTFTIMKPDYEFYIDIGIMNSDSYEYYIVIETIGK